MASRKSIIHKVSHHFDDDEVIEFTESVIRTWKPNGQPILFVPCSKRKPIQYSHSHKQIFHRFKDKSQMLILSEPMTVIPYDRFDYPNYEYPPMALWKIDGASLKFKTRLISFVSKHKLNLEECYFLLPHHHLLILWKAWECAFGDLQNLQGYAYTQATRWFFVEKMHELLDS
ncbi:MAG: hypothetical protein BAJATHORv1_20210 [Candidatus Thorarchaeota archaeon]|nr:MAG: hypothetical protein BAJATHORv1_20210 [Candidatus Thorarchaeota archaeon]